MKYLLSFLLLCGSLFAEPAPDFVEIEAWFNSEPLQMDKLRGKVVLVYFWTYGCIQCEKSLPIVNKWYNRYSQHKDKNFVIVGVHTPEYSFEHDKESVQDAINRAAIRFPVAMDNSYATWRAYENHHWPTYFGPEAVHSEICIGSRVEVLQ